MEEVFSIDSVQAYNDAMGLDTPHPLVTVFNFADIKKCLPNGRHMFGLYVMFLKDIKCGDLLYGRSTYDYQDGTVVTIGPGQVLGIRHDDSAPPPEPARGWGLAFHPDLLRGTSLAHDIRGYNFFSYDAREALHLSKEERTIYIDCLQKINTELHHAIDKHSRRLIVANIGLLLDYCMRYYDRQFITRDIVNRDILAKFESLLSDYFQSQKPQELGLPTVAWCAQELCLSPNYFGDLVKKETGKTAQEHIQLKLVSLAKDRIFEPGKSVSEIAYELGFTYPQHLTRLFKKRTGYTPNAYRATAIGQH